MKKRVLLSALTALFLTFTSLNAKVTKESVVKAAQKSEKQSFKKAPKEIITAMQNTFKALKALQMNKKDEALKYLQEADKNFDAALKANPALNLVPIDERVQAIVFMGNSKEIQKVIDTGIKLLKEHDTQVAIKLISPLKDEIDISIVNIPMKIYPVAIKQAIKLVKEGKTQDAIATVATAMNSLVVIEGIIPIPLLTAQNLVIEASKIDKNKKDEIKILLEAAKEELKRAELLGYTKKYSPEYKALNDSINAIEKEMKGKNLVAKMYEKLINDFKSLIHKTRSDSLKDSVAQMEEKALENPASVKGHKKALETLEKLEKKDEVAALKEKKIFEKEATTEEKKAVVK